MAQPLTIKEQQDLKFFLTDEVLVFYFLGINYNAVWKRNEAGRITQAMQNLPGSKRSADLFRSVMKAY